MQEYRPNLPYCIQLYREEDGRMFKSKQTITRR
jgi:hypothetical protein